MKEVPIQMDRRRPFGKLLGNLADETRNLEGNEARTLNVAFRYEVMVYIDSSTGEQVGLFCSFGHDEITVP